MHMSPISPTDIPDIPDGPLIASAAELELDAAIAGLGVICTFEAFLSEALGRGQLREALADWRQSFSGPFLLLIQPQHAGAAQGVRGFHPQGRRVEPGLISNQ